MAGRLHAVAGLSRHERRGRSSGHAPWRCGSCAKKQRERKPGEREQRGREGKEKAGREAGARRVLLQVVAGYEGVGPVRNLRRILDLGRIPRWESLAASSAADGGFGRIWDFELGWLPTGFEGWGGSARSRGIERWH